MPLTPRRRSLPVSVYDRWILSRFQLCADETRAALEQFQLSDAANGIYRFVWNELCDWAIELSKPALYGEKTPKERAGAQAALLKALEGALRLLHPFMPFVTEEVWQRLPNKSGETIMLAPFPGKGPVDEAAEREMDVISRAIDGARGDVEPVQGRSGEEAARLQVRPDRHLILSEPGLELVDPILADAQDDCHGLHRTRPPDPARAVILRRRRPPMSSSGQRRHH